jgi:hypothetical protein
VVVAEGSFPRWSDAEKERTEVGRRGRAAGERRRLDFGRGPRLARLHPAVSFTLIIARGQSGASPGPVRGQTSSALSLSPWKNSRSLRQWRRRLISRNRAGAINSILLSRQATAVKIISSAPLPGSADSVHPPPTLTAPTPLALAVFLSFFQSPRALKTARSSREERCNDGGGHGCCSLSQGREIELERERERERERV